MAVEQAKQQLKRCPQCKGSGLVGIYDCEVCRGTGKLEHPPEESQAEQGKNSVG